MTSTKLVKDELIYVQDSVVFAIFPYAMVFLERFVLLTVINIVLEFCFLVTCYTVYIYTTAQLMPKQYAYEMKGTKGKVKWAVGTTT